MGCVSKIGKVNEKIRFFNFKVLYIHIIYKRAKWVIAG